jgi:hypothetical protein
MNRSDKMRGTVYKSSLTGWSNSTSFQDSGSPTTSNVTKQQDRHPRCDTGLRHPRCDTGLRHPRCDTGHRHPRCDTGHRHPRCDTGLRHPICLLLYDGHTTHINADIIKAAKKDNIHLFVLSPHSSHRLQPLDISVFSSFKNSLTAVLSPCG